ncbi:hypothetical protein [Synechococcus phage S-B43]|jgi:hypothetical protein|nr:hypothetical protein [Synechococcus phage S-B43]
MEEERPYVELDLDIEDVYLIYNSVKFHYEKWPGGHPDEQARLNFMKDFLYRIVLQYKFENM